MALTRKQYIDSIATIAVKTCSGTGLFPSCMISQAIIESNNGNSDLSREANNHFGIKADKSWKGAVWNGKTREVISGKDVYIVDGFRWYPTLLEGFVDRNKFLKENKRYTTYGVFTAKTPQEQAKAFQDAGYATALNYSTTINSVIKANNLEKYDKQEAGVKVVIAHMLNVRSLPGTDGIIWEILYNGDKVKAEQEKDGWSYVTIVKNGCKGWVSSKYLG